MVAVAGVGQKQAGLPDRIPSLVTKRIEHFAGVEGVAVQHQDVASVVNAAPVGIGEQLAGCVANARPIKIRFEIMQRKS